MITEAVIRGFLSLLSAVFSIGPDLDPPDFSGPMGLLAPFWQAFGWANHYLPVDVAIICIGIRLLAQAATHLVTFAVWTLSKVHILGGGSQ